MKQGSHISFIGINKDEDQDDDDDDDDAKERK